MATQTKIKSVNLENYANDAARVEENFFPAMVNGLEQFQKGNRQPLAKWITIVNGRTARRVKRKDPAALRDRAATMVIVRACLDGLTKIRHDKNSDFGTVFEMSDNGGVNVEKLEALRMLAAQGARTHGPKAKLFRETFTPKSDEKKQTPKAKGVAWAKAHKPEEIKARVSSIDERIKALQAERAGLVSVKK